MSSDENPPVATALARAKAAAAAAAGNTVNGQPLPTAVLEQATSKTSVYRQGTLVYDGATGQHVGEGAEAAAPAAAPGGSLNEFLKWGIENSDATELSRRAAAGESAPKPTQIDKEIMDMLLGQPTVASMRACLGRLEPEALRAEGGLEQAAGSMEELQYYAEDIDNAIDLAKIGGLPTLMNAVEGAPDEQGLAEPELQEELREGACGVLAAAMQNNPQVQQAAVH